MAALIDVNSIVPPVSQIVSDQLINYVNTVKGGVVTEGEDVLLSLQLVLI